MPGTVFFGCTFHVIMECFTKIAGRTEAAVFTDGNNAMVCCKKHLRSHTDTVTDQIIDGGNSDTALKASGTFSGTDTGSGGDFIQCNFFHIICVYIIHHQF